jgi:hypothetical protein
VECASGLNASRAGTDTPCSLSAAGIAHSTCLDTALAKGGIAGKANFMSSMIEQGVSVPAREAFKPDAHSTEQTWKDWTHFQRLLPTEQSFFWLRPIDVDGVFAVTLVRHTWLLGRQIGLFRI